MNHEHKILFAEILAKKRNSKAYLLGMDCPRVMATKVVVYKGKKLKVGDIFDPHFSNKKVVARFPPTMVGMDMAMGFVERL
jgi:hypothetical protein